MSRSGTTDHPVNIVLGGTTAVPSSSNDTFYRDYVISNNTALTKKVHEFNEELIALRQERDILEEQVDQNESKNVTLKQHVKNFYNQAELYRQIATEDHKFFRKYLQNMRDARLRAEGHWITQLQTQSTNPTVFMVMMLICQVYFSTITGIILSLIIVGTWTFLPNNTTDSDDFENEINRLVNFKNAKKDEIAQLKRTLDIVGTAIDDLQV